MKSFTKTFYNCANLMKECTIINISNKQAKQNIIWTSQS